MRRKNRLEKEEFELLKTILPFFVLILIGLSFWISEINIFESEKETYTPKNEIIVVKNDNKKQEVQPEIIERQSFEYVEVVDSCGPYFQGECLNARSGPSTEYPAVAKIRNGAVLKVEEEIVGAEHDWYKIVFDEWLRYPERVKEDWYIASNYVRELVGYSSDGTIEVEASTSTSTSENATTTPTSKVKTIIVSISGQILYAYDENGLFMKTAVSTGNELTPTPYGTFKIFRKTPSRYMQGPIEGVTEKYYDLPGVPWDLYFTSGGAVIHGTYWHDYFGKQHSNGCINLASPEAKKLYDWAEIGTFVVIVK